MTLIIPDPVAKCFPLGNAQGMFSNRGYRFTLTTDFIFIDDVDGIPSIITVPIGFTTDFNSVPRGLWNLFPPWEYPEAAVVHDFLYRNPGSYSRMEVDMIHNRILRIEGAGNFFRSAVLLALMAFGRFPWGRYRNGQPTKPV